MSRQPTAAAKRAVTVSPRTGGYRSDVMIRDFLLAYNVRHVDANGIRLDIAHAIDDATGLPELVEALGRINGIAADVTVADDEEYLRGRIEEIEGIVSEALAQMQGKQQEPQQ